MTNTNEILIQFNLNVLFNIPECKSGNNFLISVHHSATTFVYLAGSLL